jgi:hypothetical protein
MFVGAACSMLVLRKAGLNKCGLGNEVVSTHKGDDPVAFPAPANLGAANADYLYTISSASEFLQEIYRDNTRCLFHSVEPDLTYWPPAAFHYKHSPHFSSQRIFEPAHMFLPFYDPLRGTTRD